jgi:acyl CoA:acetate/3-ketoacid CoA transferase alpha subunit
MKQKIYRDVQAIVADVHDGARIVFGGFGGARFPNKLIPGGGRARSERHHSNQQ